MSDSLKNKRVFNTMANMNKPLYFLGLKGLQLGVIFFVTLFFFLLFDLWGFLFLPVLYFPCKKNFEEWRKGCPDYFTAFRVWRQTPRQLGDHSNLLKHL